ncbi:hypothetical protein F5Y19DRAFT_490402 [Xylariaceae sp. FL1651]|nr:hypothetical protein F5Y19DRAFT_490402 [Xylariaceae sp. FL1651]
MLLTIHQVARFDIAIPSHVRIAIKYESLTTQQTESNFKSFLDLLGKRRLIKGYDDTLSLLKEDIYPIQYDGRQIRNVVTSALSLVRKESQVGGGNGKLKKVHLKKAIGNTGSVKQDYLAQLEK